MATATTPSSFSALLVSMRLMRACGCGECRILPVSMPGSDRSSVYLPAPVVLPAASTMAMGLPIMEKLVIGLIAHWNPLKASGTLVPIGETAGLAVGRELNTVVSQIHGCRRLRITTRRIAGTKCFVLTRTNDIDSKTTEPFALHMPDW